MTAVVVAARPGALALGRVAAPLALASAAVHLVLLDGSSLGSLVMVAMAVACLPCAWHLWRHPSRSVWRTTATIDATMLLVHAQMLAGPAGHSHHGGEETSSLMWLGLALVVAQLLVALVAALRR